MLSVLRQCWLITASLVIAVIAISGLVVVRSNKSMETQHACACTFDCMDGRVQRAVEEATKKYGHADLVDVVTQAGMVRVLAENKNTALIENFRMELEISVKKHGTKLVSIAAHADCAGNPVSKEEQIQHLKQAQKTIESFNLGVEVVLLWVDEPFTRAERIE